MTNNEVINLLKKMDELEYMDTTTHMLCTFSDGSGFIEGCGEDHKYDFDSYIDLSDLVNEVNKLEEQLEGLVKDAIAFMRARPTGRILQTNKTDL